MKIKYLVRFAMEGKFEIAICQYPPGPLNFEDLEAIERRLKLDAGSWALNKRVVITSLTPLGEPCIG